MNLNRLTVAFVKILIILALVGATFYTAPWAMDKLRENEVSSNLTRGERELNAPLYLAAGLGPVVIALLVCISLMPPSRRY